MVDIFGVVGILGANQPVLLHHTFFGDPPVSARLARWGFHLWRLVLSGCFVPMCKQDEMRACFPRYASGSM